MLGLVYVIIIVDIGILTMHIFTISFLTSLQVLVGGIVPHKSGTGFYLGSVVLVLVLPIYMTQIDLLGLHRVQ